MFSDANDRFTPGNIGSREGPMTERDDNDLYTEFFNTHASDSGVLDDSEIEKILRDRREAERAWEAKLAEDHEYWEKLRAKRGKQVRKYESPVAPDDRGFAPADDL
jgi:hypothetical protein